MQRAFTLNRQTLGDSVSGFDSLTRRNLAWFSEGHILALMKQFMLVSCVSVLHHLRLLLPSAHSCITTSHCPRNMAIVYPIHTGWVQKKYQLQTPTSIGLNHINPASHSWLCSFMTSANNQADRSIICFMSITNNLCSCNNVISHGSTTSILPGYISLYICLFSIPSF